MQNDRPNVVFLLPTLKVGGAEIVAVRLANALSERAKISIVVCFNDIDLQARLDPKIDVVVLGCERLRDSLTLFAGYLRREPGVSCVVSFMWPLNLFAVATCRFVDRRIAVITTDHTSYIASGDAASALRRFVFFLTTSFLYRMADARIAVSSGVAKETADLIAMSESEYRVVPNPVDLPSLQPEMKQKNIKTFICIGSFKKVKNQALALRAFSIYLRNGNDAQMVFLGDGPERPNVQNMARKLNLLRKVSFPGQVEGVDRWLSSADCLVVSSDVEGFGNVIVEAFALGVPVVSTDCPYGPKEIMDNGRYGTLVPVGCARSMAEGMERELALARDPTLLQERAECYGVRVVADAYWALMCEVVKERADCS